MTVVNEETVMSSAAKVPTKANPNQTEKQAMQAKESSKKAKKGKKPSTKPAEDKCSNGTTEIMTRPPGGYLPYSLSVITPEMAAHAKLYINETEETLKEGLRKMRELLRSDPDLVFIDTDEFLLVFLRSRKFDAKRSADFFKMGLHYVDSYRHLLDRQDRAVIRNVIRQNMVGFLPYRDAKGRAIIYARADKWDPNVFPATDAIFGGVVAVQSSAHNPVNQVSGFVVVLDLKEMTLQQVLAMSRWLIFGTITLQRACPCFMKAFHVINVPPIYKIGWKLVKPLLSEKIKKRFIFHKSSDLSTLYEYIPQEVLPKELGGPYTFTNEHWAYDLDDIENKYYSYLNNNYFLSKKKKREASLNQ